MTCGHENRGEDVLRWRTIDGMPREDLILKVQTARTVNDDRVRPRCRIRHSGQVSANRFSESFIPPVVKEIDVIRSICFARQFPDGMDVQPHDLFE